MLPAGSRLRRRADYTSAVRRGKRAHRRSLVLHLLPGSAAGSQGGVSVEDREGPALVGFVVSAAVGSAVTRNRVRRRLRHLTRDRLPLLPTGSRCVVRALRPAAYATAVELAFDLDAALSRLVGHEDDGGEP